MRDFEIAASETASRVTYGGVGTSIVAGLAQIDWAMWVGVLVAIIGLIVNFYYKYKQDRREEEEHRLYIEKLKKGECIER